MFTPLISRKKRAFTLVEMLIVIGIIAFLAAITTKIADSITKSQARAKALADMSAISVALEQFKGMYNDYPRLNFHSDKLRAPRDFYSCLAGKTSMKVQNNQIVFVDVDRAKDDKPLVDITSIALGELTTDGVNIPEKVKYDNENLCFIDPWENPYMYYYNPSLTVGSFGSWESSTYILMSNGADGKGANVRSMFTNGIMPSDEDYRNSADNRDNIVYGFDN